MEKNIKKTLKEDLEATKKLMLRQSPTNVMLQMLTGTNHFESSNYDTLYPHATEDMKTYYKEFNKPKSFLCIAASGDQIINASLTGATEINAFDSNFLCRRALALKIAALKGLNKDNFIEYFETFSPLLFASFAKNLSEEDLAYWASIYQIFDLKVVGTLIKDFIFSYKKLDRSIITEINPYLQGNNYDKAKENIKESKINFIGADIYDLHRFIGDKKYDAINLSNIYEYVNYGYNTSQELAIKYYNYLIKELYKRLNPGGSIMAAYTYAYTDDVHQKFKELYKQYNGYITYPGALNFDEYKLYLMGLTTQNLSYSYLYDLLGSNGETIVKAKTKHIEYGQSMDMTHDTAVFIKK